jgi:hypothetical protein
MGTIQMDTLEDQISTTGKTIKSEMATTQDLVSTG